MQHRWFGQRAKAQGNEHIYLPFSGSAFWNGCQDHLSQGKEEQPALQDILRHPTTLTVSASRADSISLIVVATAYFHCLNLPPHTIIHSLTLYSHKSDAISFK